VTFTLSDALPMGCSDEMLVLPSGRYPYVGALAARAAADRAARRLAGFIAYEALPRSS
jgi:hypothetical protein